MITEPTEPAELPVDRGAPLAKKRRDRTGPLQIILNAMSGAGARLLTMAVGFSLTPFIIHTVGVVQYGLFSVIGALPAYLGILDFGLGGSFVKFITEFVERGQRGKAQEVLTFGVLFYLGFGLLLAVPIFVLAPFLIHLFKMTPDQMDEGIKLFDLLFGILVISLVANVPGMAVVSMQRMDLASRNNIIGYACYAISVVVLLKAGFGIYGLVASSAFLMVVTSTLQYVTARRLFGPLWHKSLRFDPVIARRLFAFGGWTQANSIFNAINLDAGRFIAAGLVSVASVGYYEIGSKLSYTSKTMPAYVLNALMPAATVLDARGEEAALRRMYGTATRFNVAVTLAIAGFIVGGAETIVHVWLGTTYPYIAGVIFWLSLGYAVYSVAGVGTTILRASGKPRYETYYTAIATTVNVAATWPLAHRFGIVGVAMGTSLGWFAGTFFFTQVFHRVAKHGSWWNLVGDAVVRQALAASTAGCCLSLVLHQPAIARLFEHRIVGIVLLAFFGASYVVTYLALTWIFGAWDLDRQILADKFGPRMPRFLKSRFS